MSNHSSFGDEISRLFNEDSEEAKRKLDEKSKFFQEQAKSMNLGKTNNFPEGRLTGSDEGEIRLAVTNHEGKVILNFGKPILWIGLLPEQAKEIAKMLIKNAETVST